MCYMMRTWHLWICPWKLKTRWARSYVYRMIKLKNCYYLISVFQMFLETMVMLIEYGYAMNKTNLKVHVHQSPTFGLSAAQQCFIRKAITHPLGVRLRSMSSWWKACLIIFQIDLVPPQYHVARPPNHQDIVSLFLPGATSSSWAGYSPLGPWPKMEHASRRWRTP